jgi:hypothetical protein
MENEDDDDDDDDSSIEGDDASSGCGCIFGVGDSVSTITSSVSALFSLTSASAL